jgi:hypothetical protein
MSTRVASLHAEISADTTQLKRGLNDTRNDLKKTSAELESTRKHAKDLSTEFLMLGAVYAGLAAGGMALIRSTTLIASRVETLGVVTATLGRNVGMTETEVRKLEKSIQAQGITTQASRQAIAQMVQAQIELKNATNLARLAQDAAVISQSNSSEAFERLVTVVSTGNVLMARRMGLMVDFERAYQREAEALGTTTAALTEVERVQARVNEVMRVGEKITGTYEAAMDTAGKKAASLARLQEEAALAVGQAFLPAYGDAIDLVTKGFTAFNNLEDSQKRATGEAIGFTTAVLASNAAVFSSIGLYMKAAAALKSLAVAFGVASTSALLFKAAIVSIPVTVLTAGTVAAIRDYKRIQEEIKTSQGVLTDYSQKIAQTSSTYDEYIERLNQAAKAEGLAVDSLGRLTKTVGAQRNARREIIETNFALSESEYEVIRSSNELNYVLQAQADRLTGLAATYENLTAAVQAQIDINQEFSDLQLSTADPLGSHIESFQQRSRDLRTTVYELGRDIKILEGLSYLTPEQEAQLEGLRLDLEAAQGAVREHAKEHDRATKTIIFNLLAQRATRNEVTREELELLGMVAEAWGLTGKHTVDAIGKIDEALELSKTNMQGAIELIKGIGDTALSVSGDYTIRFHVEHDELPYYDERTGRLLFKPAKTGVNISKSTIDTGTGGVSIGTGGAGRGVSPTAIGESIEREVPLIERIMGLAGGVSGLGSFAADIIQRDTIDPLKQQIDAIDKLMRPGFVDITAINRMEEFERKRAEAAERLMRAEQQVLEFRKAQERMQFLEHQVRLLNLIEEHSLDIGDILGGLDFASGDWGSIIEATTRALQELTRRAAGELGIGASPLFNIPGSISTQPSTQTEGSTQIYITLDIADINSQLDIEYISRRVADEIKYRLQ